MTVLVGSEKVVAKIICGCNGYKAPSVASVVTDRPRLDAVGLYDVASKVGFGCEECLVAISEDEIVYRGNGEVTSLYRETFNLPYFNPRWIRGDGARVAFVFWPT